MSQTFRKGSFKKGGGGQWGAAANSDDIDEGLHPARPGNVLSARYRYVPAAPGREGRTPRLEPSGTVRGITCESLNAGPPRAASGRLELLPGWPVCSLWRLPQAGESPESKPPPRGSRQMLTPPMERPGQASSVRGLGPAGGQSVCPRHCHVSTGLRCHSHRMSLRTDHSEVACVDQHQQTRPPETSPVA